MERFFIDDARSIDDINATYSGKTMAEISEHEDARKEALRDEIDAKHEEFLKMDRTKMLTVQKLIDYLKKQDPNACVLAYEQNSFAYIEQLPKLPSSDICTVAEDKKNMEESLRSWYKNDPEIDSKIKKEIDMTYRYAKDTDVIIRFQ